MQWDKHNAANDVRLLTQQAFDLRQEEVFDANPVNVRHDVSIAGERGGDGLGEGGGREGACVGAGVGTRVGAGVGSGGGVRGGKRAWRW